MRFTICSKITELSCVLVHTLWFLPRVNYMCLHLPGTLNHKFIMLIASLKFYKYIIVLINFLNIESVLLLRDAKLHINRKNRRYY